MEEINIKNEQEVVKNTTVTEVVFWLSTLYNFVILVIVIFFILIGMFGAKVSGRMFDIGFVTFFLCVPILVISVPMSVISFNRLINLRKISWGTHKNTFVMFFIGTTCAVLVALMYAFSSL